MRTCRRLSALVSGLVALTMTASCGNAVSEAPDGGALGLTRTGDDSLSILVHVCDAELISVALYDDSGSYDEETGPIAEWTARDTVTERTVLDLQSPGSVWQRTGPLPDFENLGEMRFLGAAREGRTASIPS